MKKTLFIIGALCASVLCLAQKNVGKVEVVSGVYIFTDCTPIADYEVLGEVSFSKQATSKVTTMISPTGGLTTGVVSSGETAQYTTVRNALVVQAVLANRAVEGIMLKDLGEGTGRAVMIKFTDSETDHALAKVNNYFGFYVFTDCTPVTEFTTVKKVKGKLGYLNASYGNIRDHMTKKATRRAKDANAVVIHLVDGGRDYVEAIKFIE